MEARIAGREAAVSRGLAAGHLRSVSQPDLILPCFTSSPACLASPGLQNALWGEPRELLSFTRIPDKALSALCLG